MNNFVQLWEDHMAWSQGVLVNEVVELPFAKVYLSPVEGPYYSFGRLHRTPTKDELSQLEKEFTSRKKQPSLFVDRYQHEEKLTDFLVRSGYHFGGNDTWMLLNENLYSSSDVNADVVKITPETFDDFEAVLGVVFKDFGGNKTYLDICKKSNAGDVSSDVDDFGSELYVIYDDKKPVAGAGVFYSKSKNVAYLHNAGTLESARGKGYQTALIRHRVNLMLEKGITRQNSIVSLGSISWANMIKNGFEEAGNMFVMTKPQK